MAQQQFQTGSNEQLKEIPYFEGVCFDPDSNTVHGNYTDEVSAYRARKNWKDALRFNFNLEEGYDYICVIDTTNKDTFILSCRFQTTSGKYAFWKITNNQCPEVQYIIETAHIPVCDSRYEEILTAPDLRSIYDLRLSGKSIPELHSKSKLSKLLKKVLDT